MRLIYCLLAALCLFVSAAGQPLHKGDRVPDLAFPRMINYDRPSARLSDFRARLLLVNIWATNCGACIRGVPVLDSMRKAHPGELGVLLVCASPKEDSARVYKAFKRMKNAGGSTVTLPVVTGDTMLSHYFPHTFVPRFAWLDSDFEVIAVTGEEEVTPERIEDVLAGRPVSFLPSEDMHEFNRAKLLFVGGNGGEADRLLTRSTMSRYIPGIASQVTFTRDSSGQISRILATNQPIAELLKTAYCYTAYPPRVRYPEGEQSLLERKGKRADWFIDNAFTYELVLAPAPDSIALRYMQEDIRRSLGYTAALKSTPADCYVLRADSAKLSRFRSRGGKPVNTLNQGSGRQLHNRPVSDLVEWLSQNLPLPVLNENSYTANIDIELPAIDPQDIERLAGTLETFGLRLIRTSRQLDCFFIYHLSN